MRAEKSIIATMLGILATTAQPVSYGPRTFFDVGQTPKKPPSGKPWERKKARKGRK